MARMPIVSEQRTPADHRASKKANEAVYIAKEPILVA